MNIGEINVYAGYVVKRISLWSLFHCISSFCMSIISNVMKEVLIILKYADFKSYFYSPLYSQVADTA